ncbi:MAG: choice-of-anchor L domain-containing protein [Saprospiraceae bacterium]|nr:choice-of-anchor L domain-containing protein [Saprospiraceae bacterium]MCF8249952.1 choice-of-anchor L domain-containing protein [Saprospiraceae bacterium]MCF8279365.1 choice-of-anchor L domain-containing protein [Bacteroidales bacterium]MCF8310056.1 choice-of-anchor L domain-containing protein [Saprospiraceae bacterium]MCF8438956.1 choice-of-anchor L domain-containing protein [Saprospiraceae bacterium]
MKLSVPIISLVSVFLFTGMTSSAQNTYNIDLTDYQHREEINFATSEQNVHVCGLESGKTYQVWANTFSGCHPTVKVAGSGQFNTTITFTATADCMDFILKKDQSTPNCAAGTVWFSIGCNDCGKKTDSFSKISCTSNPSGTYLIEDVFIGGGCFDITNVMTIGAAAGRGTFTDGVSTVNMQDGIVLTSGDVGLANGPNNSNSAGSNVGGPTSDPDLDILTGGGLHDVQGIEFDFRPTISTVSFQYVFGSEEYCEFVNSGFNDVFGFFISGPGISGGFSSNGQDIAVLPGSGIFVSINNVNHLSNTAYFIPNQTNCGGFTNMDDIQYDGYTQMLIATANVVPCETYHIRLVIADVGDGIYDSGVFLGAGTFSAGGTATGEAFSASTGSNIVYESCNDGTFIFTRAGGDINLPLTLNFTILPSSTATSGADYTPFPFSVTIPPGLNQIVLPIDIIADNIPEGVETIVLSLTNSCSCSSLEMILEIHDPPPVEVDLPDLEACEASPIYLEAMPTGGIPNTSYTYLWSTGSTNPVLQTVPIQNTTYTVTVTDDCGETATASSFVSVSPLPSATMNSTGGVLCTSNPNASIDLVVEFTGTPNWILEYSINGNPQIPILVTSTPYTISTNIPGIYLLTNVVSELGNCAGPAVGVAVIDIETITNNVIVTSYTCSDNGTMTVIPTGGMDPYNYVWSNGFPNFETQIGLLPGTYMATVTDANGCTASATGVVTTPPILTSIAQGSQVNCTNPTGGTITLTVGGGTSPYYYLWSDGSTDQNPTGLSAGTYIVTVTDDYACTSTASADVVSSVSFPVAVAQSLNELDCNTQVITVLGLGSETGPTINYEWSGPGINGAGNQIDVNVQTEGLYTLVVTDISNGCTASASALVTADLAPPFAIATGNSLNCVETFTTVSGNGSSAGPEYTYQWTGPNVLGGENNIDATVGAPGTYTLVVTNNTNGCTAFTSADVVTNAVYPDANIVQPSPLTCAVDTLTLDGNGSSSGPTYTYQWSYNNTPIIGATSLTTIATSTGAYQIVVTDVISGCTSSYSTTVTENVSVLSPMATASGEITCTVGTVPLSSSITGNPSNYTFAWSTTNGSFDGSTNGQNATAASPGLYQVLVTDNSNGCTGTATVQVTQDASLPNVQVTSSGNIDCVDTQVQLNGNGSSQGSTITYTWTTPDGNFVSGQNTLTPVVDLAGTYILTLFDSSNSCDNESSVTVTVDNLPPNIVMPPSSTLDCAVTQTTLTTSISNPPAGGVLDYTWTTSNGQFNDPTDILSPNVVAPGTYTLVVENTLNGCTSSGQVVVNEDVALPVISIANPDVLTCTSNTVPLNATGTSTGIVFQYGWSSPTGSFVTSNSILNPVVNAAGTYTLLVTNTMNNCTATQQVIVNEDVDLPTALAGSPLTLNCDITELNLNGNGSSVGQEFQYLWTGPGVVSNETTLSPLIDEPGTYQLLITNAVNDCQTTATVTIVEDITPPTADAGTGDTLSCSQTALTLDGTGSSTGNNFSYVWDSPNGSISSGNTTLTPSINAPGDYFITVTNTSNGCTSTDIVQIDEDDSLPDAETVAAPPITCNVQQLTLDGTGSAVGPEFTYLWSTNNGIISSGDTTLNPVITAPGIYLLTVTNTATNCSSIASVTVASQTSLPAVEAGPAAQLTCTATSLTLSGNGSASGANFTYLWTTVNGNIVAGNTTLNPMVDEPGTYVLEVTNNQTGCVNTDQVTVAQNQNTPLSVASTPGVLNCNNLNLTLSGNGSSTGSTMNYAWSTIDGNIVSGATTLSPVINEPGTYLLTVSNSSNGCTESATVVVDQDIAVPTAEAGSANQPLSCSLNTVTLDGNGSSAGSNFTYLWSTNNGNIVSGATTLNPIVNQVGTYVLTVTNTTNGCVSNDNVEVMQDNSLPQATIAPPNTLTCDVVEMNLSATASQGSSFGYLWTTMDGFIVTGENTLSPQINQPGTYLLTVTNSSNGCTITTQASVNQDIALPNANAGQPFVMDCFEELNSLDGSASTGTGSLSFSWSSQNGALVSGSNTANPFISEPGTYVLTVTNLDNGCQDSSDVLITRDGPVSQPEAIQPPCYDDKGSIALSGTTGGTTPYLYSIDNGDSFSNSAIFTDLQPGLYYAVVQDAHGCEFEEEILIEQPNLFNIDIEPQVTLQLGESYQLNTLVNVPESEIELVDWFPIFNLSCTDCLNPIATPSSSMTYVVTVVSKNGCEDSAPIFFRVDKTGGVYVPNAFSPNGDGTNDVFMIFSNTKSVRKVNSFLVFNRWGESVYQYFNFEPNNPAFGWDGVHRNQKLDPAVFIWFAEIEFIDGRVEVFKGDVTLIR